MGRKYRRLSLSLSFSFSLSLCQPVTTETGRTLLIRCDRDLDPSRSVIRENGRALAARARTIYPAAVVGGGSFFSQLKERRKRMRSMRREIFIATENNEGTGA